MNAIKKLYRNAGLVTKDGYVKVNDNLWVKTGLYEIQSWDDADKSILPTKAELNEIYLKIQELIQIQETCGLESLSQILDIDRHHWAWSSTERDGGTAWLQSLNYGGQTYGTKCSALWVVPIRRTL